MKTFKNILYLLSIVLIAILILCFSKYLLCPLPIIKQIDKLLQTPALGSTSSDAILNIALAILKTTGLVLQAMGIGIAVLAVIGIKEILNVRKISKEVEAKLGTLEKEYNKFRRTSIDFEQKINKKIRLEYDFIQAKIFFSQGFYEDAWGILSKLPDNISYEICLYKGMVLTKRQDYSDAITNFECALKFRDADEARIYFSLGGCWYQNREYDKAIEEFDKAIKIRSNYWSAYNNKALALKRLGKLKEAIIELKKIVSIDKKNDTACYNLACYYSLLTEVKEALVSLKISLDLNPKRKKRAKEDPDFANIRNLVEFKELTDDDDKKHLDK